MDLPIRKAIRLKNYNYSQCGAYFITICTLERKKILSKIAVGTPLPECTQESCLELLRHGQIAEKFIQQMDTFYDYLSVDKYVIMPDQTDTRGRVSLRREPL